MNKSYVNTNEIIIIPNKNPPFFNGFFIILDSSLSSIFLTYILTNIFYSYVKSFKLFLSSLAFYFSVVSFTV